MSCHLARSWAVRYQANGAERARSGILPVDTRSCRHKEAKRRRCWRRRQTRGRGYRRAGPAGITDDSATQFKLFPTCHLEQPDCTLTPSHPIHTNKPWTTARKQTARRPPPHYRSWQSTPPEKRSGTGAAHHPADPGVLGRPRSSRHRLSRPASAARHGAQTPAYPGPCPPAGTSRLCSVRARSPRAAGSTTRAGAAPTLRWVRERVTEHFRSVLRGTASGPPRWTPGRGAEPPTISASGAGAFSQRKDVSRGNVQCRAGSAASSGSRPGDAVPEFVSAQGLDSWSRP